MASGSSFFVCLLVFVCVVIVNEIFPLHIQNYYYSV